MSSRPEQFLEVYRVARVENQREYYERGAANAEAAHRQLLLITAIIFGVSGAVAVLAGLGIPGRRGWAVLAAILPALTTALSAYNGLYSFGRVRKLFRDAAHNLRRAQPPRARGSDAQTAVARYVSSVEQILASERGQWGQLELEARPDQHRAPTS
jgi:hypothetical protein